MINPATIAQVGKDLVALGIKHPTIAEMVVNLVRLAVTSKNPWRSVVRHFVRVAAEHASDELANALMGLETVSGKVSQQQRNKR